MRQARPPRQRVPSPVFAGQIRSPAPGDKPLANRHPSRNSPRPFRRQSSSVVEQRFRKPQVTGSSPVSGSPLSPRKSDGIWSFDAACFHPLPKVPIMEARKTQWRRYAPRKPLVQERFTQNRRHAAQRFIGHDAGGSGRTFPGWNRSHTALTGRPVTLEFQFSRR